MSNQYDQWGEDFRGSEEAAGYALPPEDDPPVLAQAEPAPDAYGFTAGGAFILDTPADPVPLWGCGDEVLWADGEALMITGRQGLGKSTLSQQLTLGRCGIHEYTELLGYPITPGERRVLYLAMDRPNQVARSLRRMVCEDMRGQLDERLVVRKGPPPFDIAKHEYVLRDLARAADADTVVVDSVKDAAVGLSDDEVGAGYNRARQLAIADGIQVLEGHHNRKAQQGAGKAKPDLDDVYGSTWLTSGAGSVLYLTGAPGDPIVGVHHVKQPAAEVGPLRLMHDHATGRSTIWHATDLVRAAEATRDGITPVDAARLLFEVDKPTPAQREKARRKLESLTKGGLLRVLVEGDRGSKQPARYGPAGVLL